MLGFGKRPDGTIPSPVRNVDVAQPVLLDVMRKFLKVLLWVAAVVVGVLLLVRFAGSPLATQVANRKLAGMPQFTGRVGAVKLALWRGTVVVENLRLSDRQHPGDGDIVIVPHAMLSLAWGPMFKGRVGGEGAVEGAQVVMVKRAETARDEKEKAKKLAKPVVRAWQGVLAKQFPIEFSKIEVRDSTVRFDDRSDPEVVSLTIDRINLVAEGFANREKQEGRLPASMRMNARIGGSGTITADARLDPAEEMPTFETKLEVKGLSLVKIHDFLVRYALVDVSSGEFELYAEAKAEGGGYDGYTKPFFKNLKFEAVPDPEKNLLQRAAVKVAAAVQDALKNERDQVATKAPFHGDFEDTKVDAWTTLENLLRNAFIQALREGLEGQPSGKES